jgi:hypothetical protein
LKPILSNLFSKQSVIFAFNPRGQLIGFYSED